MFRVGEVARIRAFYKQGMVGVVPNAAVTVDYTDESGNLTAGASPSAGAITGEYYFDLTPDAAGIWFIVFKTTATNTSDQEQATTIEVDAAAFTPAGIAAAVVAGVWNALRSAYVVVGSMGEAMTQGLAKVIAPGGVKVASAGPDDEGVLTVVIGDAYDADHSNAIQIPIPSAPDVSTATLTFTVEGITLSPAVTATVTGAGDDRVAVVELSAAHTTQLDSLPLGFPRLNRTYWRVRATWTESPTKPQTIAYGEIRRPVWDQA